MKKTTSLQIAIFIVFLIVGCERKPPAHIIAKVGNLAVSSFEFEEKYAHHLLNTDAIDSQIERNIILERLITKKLLANASIKENISLDSSDITIINERINKAIRKALYEKVIPINDISISDSLLRVHFLWKNTDVFVRHIFSINKSDIDSIYSLLISNPHLFEQIAQHSFIHAELAESGGTLGWVSYDQMDPAFEIAMYTLPLDSISKPVRSAYGWHIIQILDKRVRGIITESDYQKNKSEVEKSIISKQKQITANDYVNNLMMTSDVNINDTLTVSVLTIIKKLLKNQGKEYNSALSDTTKEFNQSLIKILKLLVHEKMATFKYGTFTVNDFISRLHLLPTNVLRQNLLKGFYLTLRDKILEEKARAIGLEKDPVVSVKIHDAEDDVRATIFLSSLSNNSHIKSSELKQLTDSLRSIYDVSVYREHIDLLFNEKAAP